MRPGYINEYGIRAGFNPGNSAEADGCALKLRHVNDGRYFTQLLDVLEQRSDVDANQIFVMGLSNGAGMMFNLSCSMSHRIAGFIGSQTLPVRRNFHSRCTDPNKQLKPLLLITGSLDATSGVQQANFLNLQAEEAQCQRPRHYHYPHARCTVIQGCIGSQDYTHCLLPRVAHRYAGDGCFHSDFIFAAAPAAFKTSNYIFYWAEEVGQTACVSFVVTIMISCDRFGTSSVVLTPTLVGRHVHRATRYLFSSTTASLLWQSPLLMSWEACLLMLGLVVRSYHRCKR
jgi:dienelactone hydrolase